MLELLHHCIFAQHLCTAFGSRRLQREAAPMEQSASIFLNSGAQQMISQSSSGFQWSANPQAPFQACACSIKTARHQKCPHRRATANAL